VSGWFLHLHVLSQARRTIHQQEPADLKGWCVVVQHHAIEMQQGNQSRLTFSNFVCDLTLKCTSAPIWSFTIRLMIWPSCFGTGLFSPDASSAMLLLLLRPASPGKHKNAVLHATR
jgi:hypothetical protein